MSTLTSIGIRVRAHLMNNKDIAMILSKLNKYARHKQFSRKSFMNDRITNFIYVGDLWLAIGEIIVNIKEYAETTVTCNKNSDKCFTYGIDGVVSDNCQFYIKEEETDNVDIAHLMCRLYEIDVMLTLFVIIDLRYGVNKNAIDLLLELYSSSRDVLVRPM